MSADSPDLHPHLEAEQAALGACLLDPEQLAELGRWLEPRHFHRPAHRALFALLLDHQPPASASSDGETRRAWALTVITTATQAIPGFTAAYGQALIAACPSPAHAASYARMVLESAVHRALAQHAHQLLAAAEAGDLAATVDLTRGLHQVIDRLATAWGTPDPRPLPSLPAPPPAGGREPDAEREHERMLLATLLHTPGQVAPIASWLLADDIADPGHRAVFTAMAALAHRREPVDSLTVLWEVQRRGALTDGALTLARTRQLLADPLPGDPGYWAERVLETALLRTSATSAGIVRVMALDASLTAGTLLAASLRALALTDRIQERHRAATGTGLPPRTGPAVLGARRKAATRTITANPSARAGTSPSPPRP